MRGLVLLLVTSWLLVLNGCGGSPPRQDEPPTEQASLDRSARLAFEQGRYEQAASLYEATLQAALKEDAAQAIVDARFNLALCQMYQGQYAPALDQLSRAEAERERRGLSGDGSLGLLAATIHYRRAEPGEARRIVDGLLADATTSDATRAKAHFVAGLVAADTGDVSALRRHLAGIGPEAPAGSISDRSELAALLDGLQGNTAAALSQLDRVVLARRVERDYRGMVRALARAGDLAAATQQPQAAARYLLRAGRSALQFGEPDAQRWLQRAASLAARAEDNETAREAETLLRRSDVKTQ